jgi:hypothetical protein
MKRATGQSLAQYGLVVGLVSIVAIGSLVDLGGWANRLIRNTIRTGQAPPASAGTPASPSTGTPVVAVTPAPVLIPPSMTGLGPVRQYTLPLRNGQTLTVPLVDPEAAAETGGVNGVTRNALGSLDSVIAQLERLPQENPRLLPALQELSRRGHIIQEAQDLIARNLPVEGFANSDARFNHLQETYVQFKGKELNLATLDRQLGLRGLGFGPDSMIAHSELVANYINENIDMVLNGAPASEVANPDITPLLYDFLDQYQTVQSSGLLEDPVLKQLVGDQLTCQIAVSSIATTSVGDKSNMKKLVQLTQSGAKGLCELSHATDCSK